MWPAPAATCEAQARAVAAVLTDEPDRPLRRATPPLNISDRIRRLINNFSVKHITAREYALVSLD